MTAFMVTHMNDSPTNPMRMDGGVTQRMVGPQDGATSVDLDMNVTNVDWGLGPYPCHSRAENVWVVLDGITEVVVEGACYLLVRDDVAFIPPGVKTPPAAPALTRWKMLEIYASAGQGFLIVEVPEKTTPVARPNIQHLLPPELRSPR